MLRRGLIMLCIIGLTPACLQAELAFQSAMVKIFTITNPPDYANPWNMNGPGSISGSGVVIEGNRILTNAHVVSHLTYMQVRAHGSAQKYDAQVIAVSHEADLAVVGVDDPSFFEGITPLRIGGLPELQEPIVVCGFPTGGDTMSMTAGVVSRIEHQTYSHSYLDLLAIQVDAAINPGNSGGPALSKQGRIVGVAMQNRGSAENIAYLIPTPVIEHFLTDIEDDRYDGVPTLGIACQATENEALKEKLGMTADMTGVLINRVVEGSSAANLLRPGDVILKIDDFDVASDATIAFRPRERTRFDFAVQCKQMGETVSFDILREGQIQTIRVGLNHPMEAHSLVRIENDKAPTYFIYSGLVFNPLTINYLECWGQNWYNDAPKDLLAYLKKNWQRPQQKEIVVLNRVLPIEANVGYHYISDVQVVSINGREITCMQDVVDILQGHSDAYADIRVAGGFHIILKREDDAAAMESIKTVYKIEAAISDDLVDRRMHPEARAEI